MVLAKVMLQVHSPRELVVLFEIERVSPMAARLDCRWLRRPFAVGAAGRSGVGGDVFVR